MARSRDISKVLSSSTALATDSEIAATYQTKAAGGLTLLVPVSITNTGGTASIGANGTVTFSGASSISLNGVFSSSYDNYRIVASGLQTASSQEYIAFRLRISGTDNSSGVYRHADRGLLFTNGSGSDNNDNAGTSWLLGYTNVPASNRFAHSIMDVFNPFSSTINTNMFRTKTMPNDTYPQFRTGGGDVTVTTSYDSFTIYPGSSTLTGKLSVYGYNQ